MVHDFGPYLGPELHRSLSKFVPKTKYGKFEFIGTKCLTCTHYKGCLKQYYYVLWLTCFPYT